MTTPPPRLETPPPTAAPTAFHGAPWRQVAEGLEVDPATGLSDAEAARRLARVGPNTLKKAAAKSIWEILVSQFRSLVVALLIAAAVLSAAFGEWTEGSAIAVVIVINTLIGFITEIRATRSMETLRRLGVVRTTVRRDGRLHRIPGPDLVPGDVVVLEAGDVVAADMRLITAARLEADESTLTGESLPVAKQTETLPGGDVILAERTNMVHRGTAVTLGSGTGVVVATGMETEIGRISALIQEAGEGPTPLTQRLDRLAHWLVWVTLVVAVVVAAMGIAGGKPVFLMIETSIALAVAAIPEGLPIVVTVALSRGMWRMARRNALINRLTSVETLGVTDVICADKTGTLTENRLSVDSIELADGAVEVDGGEAEIAEPSFRRDGAAVAPLMEPALRAALETAVLCNTAQLTADGDGALLGDFGGDPLEVALLRVGAMAGLHRPAMLATSPEVGQEPFSSTTKMMATFHRENGGVRVAVKGAPEAVIETCTSVLCGGGVQPLDEEGRNQWMERNFALAGEGARMLALAEKVTEANDESPYSGLTLIGLIAFRDPPREGAREAVGLCRKAGIKVIMVTGDQVETARSIAREVGLLDEETCEGESVIHGKDLPAHDKMTEGDRARALAARIFARVTPAQKLDIIALHQEKGNVVAMTGDGVNDAPALKKAEIGIAMGGRGTEVAREASDMVLSDDSFATIVDAVAQGRVIFANIRNFVLYLLSCNGAEVLVIFLASASGAPLPILPLQILFLNLVTDVFPALALGFGEGDKRVMDQPPRPGDEPVITRRQWQAIGGYSLLITAATLGAFAVAIEGLGMDAGHAVTVSFSTLAFAQLWHVFNMRGRGTAFLKNDVMANPYVWAALALCTALLLAAIYAPGLAEVLKLQDPGAAGWAVILTMSAVPWAVGQILKGGLKGAWWAKFSSKG